MPASGTCFSWEELLPRIEEVDRTNSVLEIDLPEEEWRRLAAEDLASLKARLSPGAAGRLILLDDPPVEGRPHIRYYLLVCHYGRCPF